MPVADQDRVREFVQALCATNRGLVVATNMVDSCSAASKKLIHSNLLCEFLNDCVRRFDASTALDKLPSMVERVAEGGAGQRSYLRQCKLTDIDVDPPHMLTNVLKAESFHRFLLSPAYKRRNESETVGDGLVPILPTNPRDKSAFGLEDYRNTLAAIVSRPDWRAEGGTLGKPYPAASNCWLSTDRFGSTVDGPPYPADDATKARDELGLIDYTEGVWLLQVRFPMSTLTALPDVEVARPTFADLGNSRFRVEQRSAKAAAYAASGWGATVHLGGFSTGAYATGLPERVVSPLLITALRVLDVQCLGLVWSQGDSADCDADFLRFVLDGRSREEVVDSIMQLVAESGSVPN